MNAHAGCYECNVLDDRHRMKYTLAINLRYGNYLADDLVRRSRSIRKLMRFELFEMIEMFKLKLKQ
jgi:hypothetical protein